MTRPAIYITDIHVHNFQAFDVKGSRLLNCLDTIERAFDTADSVGSDTVLFGGDLYESHKMLPTQVEEGIIKMFKKMFKKYPTIKWYCITGNHDQATKSLYGNEGFSALRHLSMVFPNIEIIDNTAIKIGDCRVYGIPYYSYGEHYHNALDDLIEAASDTKETNKVLLIHQTPSGNSLSIPADTDCRDKRYKTFDMVLCGHIHVRQKMSDNFWLGGSPIPKDYSDIGQVKGIHIIDLENPKDLRFVSWESYYPNFVYVQEGDEAPKGQYSTKVARKITLTDDESKLVKTYNIESGMDEKEILKSYWKDNSDDTALWGVGLEIYKKSKNL